MSDKKVHTASEQSFLTKETLLAWTREMIGGDILPTTVCAVAFGKDKSGELLVSTLFVFDDEPWPIRLMPELVKEELQHRLTEGKIGRRLSEMTKWNRKETE